VRPLCICRYGIPYMILSLLSSSAHYYKRATNDFSSIMTESLLEEPLDLQLDLSHVSHHSTSLSDHQTMTKLPEKQRTYGNSPSESLEHQKSVEFAVFTPHNIGIVSTGPRGPKTKAQRDHAAKMRKIGSCKTCKQKKRRVSNLKPTFSAHSKCI